jgi:flagellar basal-body rod modification protein FlgD
MVAQVTQSLPTGLASFEERKAAAAAPKSDELGRQEFLKLLTTQLQNQNPLDPMKNEQFVAQLAQFSTLEATLSMSGSLDNFVSSRKENDILEASNLIGRSVAVANGQGFRQSGADLPGYLSLPSGADAVFVNVVGAAGDTVRTIEFGQQGPGTFEFAWDGLDNAGREAAPGAYRLEAMVALGGQVSREPVKVFSEVSGIRRDAAGTIELELLGGAVLGLGQVERIGN